MTISIIGAGNLGISIANGLIQDNFIKPQDLALSRRNVTKLKEFSDKGVKVFSNNIEAIQYANVIILCIKPFNCKEVLGELQKHIKKNQVIVSSVTGFWIKDIEEVIGSDIPVCRVMPNVAIEIKESLTAICYNKQMNKIHQDLIISIFNTLGKSVLIEEKLMDSATVLGACGIAYALKFIRASIQGGIEIGFDYQTANLIVSQTVKGAAELLIKTNRHPEQEIDRVTTPKGCTISGINEMEHQGFSSSLIKGITASFKKIVG